HARNTVCIQLRVACLHHRRPIAPTTRVRHDIKVLDTGRVLRGLYRIRHEAYTVEAATAQDGCRLPPAQGKHSRQYASRLSGFFTTSLCGITSCQYASTIRRKSPISVRCTFARYINLVLTL